MRLITEGSASRIDAPKPKAFLPPAILANVTSEAWDYCYKRRVMTTANFAACVGDGETFSEEEAPTGPTSAVASKGLGFWLPAPSRPVLTPTPPSSARIAPKRSSRPPAAPATHAGAGSQVRKVAVVSEAMQRVAELIGPLARADVTVTLTGETGTGKDVLARTVHQQSARAAGPFVVFDCGAVAANLAESELLGHERGAFTGALATHVGAFERAHQGTLFLDEIGELPLDLQTRLLRVLGNRCIRRVGGTVDRPFDVRIVAATNRDLQVEVAAGRFRQDLYFRLAAAVVNVPPLRDRTEDIPLLAQRLLEDLGHGTVEIAADALELLMQRQWPGNVRELKNVLACAVAFLDGERLEARHLAFPAPAGPSSELQPLPLGGLKLERIEREAIAQTLRLTGGNKARAAEMLGIASSTLYEKLKRYQKPTDS
jgi:two-component system, NtrC family, response regulator HydG